MILPEIALFSRTYIHRHAKDVLPHFRRVLTHPILHIVNFNIIYFLLQNRSEIGRFDMECGDECNRQVSLKTLQNLYHLIKIKPGCCVNNPPLDVFKPDTQKASRNKKEHIIYI